MTKKRDDRETEHKILLKYVSTIHHDSGGGSMPEPSPAVCPHCGNTLPMEWVGRTAAAVLVQSDTPIKCPHCTHRIDRHYLMELALAYWVRTKRMPPDVVVSEGAKQVVKRRKVNRGRERVIRQCPYTCGAKYSAREMRVHTGRGSYPGLEHIPLCPKKP
jgi:DNA-directed RNA polymerase subunit RPC12/RpoP